MIHSPNDASTISFLDHVPPPPPPSPSPSPSPLLSPSAHPPTSPPVPQGSASTLTRSEVRGGGKKPYNQKGTGGARRGTQRTPLRPGGGQLFGPKPRDYTISMNKKERRLALSTALQSAAANNMIAIEDTSSWSEMKTSTLVKTLKACGADPMADDEKRVLMIVGAFNDALFMAGRNIAKLDMCTTDNLNIFAVLKASKIVVDEKALAILSEYFGENGEAFKSHYELE